MGIIRAAIILMLGNAASRILGLVRAQVIAALFGASALTDAYTAASRIPTSIYDLLIGGMISAALVPVFSGYSQDEDSRELWNLASTVINLALLVLTIAVAIMIVAAPQLIWIFSGGYDAEIQATAVTLLRIMLPSILFMGIGGVLTGLHYSQHSYRIPSLCITLYNASIIIVALLFHEVLSINSLVIGVLLGSFLQMAILFLQLKKMRYSLILNLSHPALRKIISLYIPVGLGLVVSNIGVAIDTNLASQTGEGSLAAMQFATFLTQLPLGLVASAVSFAILPSLSRSASAFFAGVNTRATTKEEDPRIGDHQDPNEHQEGFKSTLSFGLKAIILAILPATVGLVVLREPLIQILFERGSFDPLATGKTALAFLAYSPSLPAAAVDQLLIFAFYARKNTVIPVLVGVMGVGVYLVVALSLVGPLGMPGLALANSAQISAHALVMFLLLWRAIDGLKDQGLASTTLKALASSLLMGAVCYGTLYYMAPFTQESGLLFKIAVVSFVSIAGLLVYLIGIIALRVEETRIIWSFARTRIGR